MPRGRSYGPRTCPRNGDPIISPCLSRQRTPREPRVAGPVTGDQLSGLFARREVGFSNRRKADEIAGAAEEHR